MRGIIREHRSFLLGLTANKSTSRKLFISRVLKRVLEVESPNSDFIKIVSIDVPRVAVHSVLRTQTDADSDVLNGRLHYNAFEKGEYTGTEYVLNTHVTLAHHSQLPQTELRNMFQPIVNKQVEVQITSLVWSQRIAALAVSIPPQTTDGIDIPQAQNLFTHVTIWHLDGVPPSVSNSLPQLLGKGQAKRIQFHRKTTLTGKIRFWKFDEHS